MRSSVIVTAVLGLLILGLVPLGGCATTEEKADESSREFAGVYVSEEHHEDYIEIRANNTFRMVSDGDEIIGSCDVEEDALHLSAGSFAETMSIHDGVITGEDGTEYVKEGSEESSASPGPAIEKYCKEHHIDIPELNVSNEKDVSASDPSWEVVYAFPAEAEGNGQFFLVQRTAESWTVIAHTEGAQAGWTAEQLEALGAPADLAEH